MDTNDDKMSVKGPELRLNVMPDGSVRIRANIKDKILMRSVLEIALNKVIDDTVKESKIIWTPTFGPGIPTGGKVS